MKKKGILFLVFSAIIIIGILALIFGNPAGNIIIGYVIMKASEKSSNNFYFLIAAFILAVAVSTYIHSIKKFGPA